MSDDRNVPHKYPQGPAMTCEAIDHMIDRLTDEIDRLRAAHNKRPDALRALLATWLLDDEEGSICHTPLILSNVLQSDWPKRLTEEQRADLACAWMGLPIGSCWTRPAAPCASPAEETVALARKLAAEKTARPSVAEAMASLEACAPRPGDAQADGAPLAITNLGEALVKFGEEMIAEANANRLRRERAQPCILCGTVHAPGQRECLSGDGGSLSPAATTTRKASSDEGLRIAIADLCQAADDWARWIESKGGEAAFGSSTGQRLLQTARAWRAALCVSPEGGDRG